MNDDVKKTAEESKKYKLLLIFSLRPLKIKIKTLLEEKNIIKTRSKGYPLLKKLFKSASSSKNKQAPMNVKRNSMNKVEKMNLGDLDLGRNL